MSHILDDHFFLICGVVTVVLLHGAVLAYWIKLAAKPVVRGSGNPYMFDGFKKKR